jgi:hypothetical protein
MYYPDDPDPRVASIVAYDLKSLRTLDGGQPIVSLIRYQVPKERSKQSTAGPLLNGYVSGFEVSYKLILALMNVEYPLLDDGL